MKITPQVEPETTKPEQIVSLQVTLQDAETISHVQGIVHAKMQNEPYWGDIVLDVLQSYDDRGKGLSDWWIYSRFLATFGAWKDGISCTALSCWTASDKLDELLTAWEALATFEGWGWFKRLRYRKIQRRAFLDLLTLLSALKWSHEHWCDVHDFVKYSKARRG
jgi:hypothetical protein